MRIERKRNIRRTALPYAGIFSVFLLITAMAVFFWSPTVGSHADSGRTTVGMMINPIISLTLDKNEVVLHLTPDPSESTTYAEEPITATVDTNSANGYQLYLSSIDNVGNMTSETTDAVISAPGYFDYHNDKPLELLGNKKWGYSMSGSGEHYMGIPFAKKPKQIAWVHGLPDATTKETTLYFGANINMQLPSGRYSAAVEFTAIANQVDDPTAFASITTMQEMTHEICANAVVGASTMLVDTRDGKQYPVEKLEDGECWMKNDLRLVGPRTLTASDSNVQNDFNLPATLQEGVSIISQDGFDEPILQNAFGYMANEIDGTGYNYCAATAGTICEEGMEDEAVYSICPKGWTMPSKEEFDNLLDTYDLEEHAGNDNGKYERIIREPFNYSLSRHGHMDDENGNYGASWWTTTNDTNKYRTVFNISFYSDNSSYVMTTIYGADDGAAVRCIAE